MKDCKLIIWCLVCCIYHAPRGIDSSSDESSSDSDDSDSGADNGGARPAKGKCGPGDGHDHGGHDHGKGGKKGKGKERERSPNAYEKVPRVKDKASGVGGGKGVDRG